ncbi:MAG: riboflavin synthase [Ostreibacterium sp.]
MFTGIIQDLGIIKSIKSSGIDTTISIQAKHLQLNHSTAGDSIAVNGVCLTATKIEDDTFWLDISHESLDKTTLHKLKIGQSVNLEKALTLSTPLGGHLVSGHVDGVGKLLKKSLDGNSTRYYFESPMPLMKYIASKGSITIQGISLTVNNTVDNGFDVAIIPHTETVTNLGKLPIGGEVNLEIDLIARYVAKLLSSEQQNNYTL